MDRAITIEFIHPPIPVRTFDFCATFDDEVRETTDGIVTCGYGRTPLAAMTDLLMWVAE